MVTTACPISPLLHAKLIPHALISPFSKIAHWSHHALLASCHDEHSINRCTPRLPKTRVFLQLP
ncbi:hypothetical protein SERLADRAFT_460405 [Serpula lacrymans var. lacrymans S7.9]|uniref:Uncharacterized protein n=1 Tax=Serpula lacrymans var. lacrymans (strain S7.9) TaxID=578457 RepID=F8NLX1_SERL9|nr:uncharacterized protein SERLADRAFT_460405 [Serpula lacrymans var. lacrymans S7.9]EGO27275.1 hypothetical protein SERLADRAFT_460405 [Serpula lacrymans var. lacrymans S7.9]